MANSYLSRLDNLKPYRLYWLLCSIFLISCTKTSNANKLEEPNSVKGLSIQGKFLPPDNKILLFVGQDSDTISDYVKGVPEDNIEGITLYTSIKSAIPEKALPAIASKANWKAGDVDYEKSLAESPQAALAIGLAFDTCKQINHQQKIVDGKYDQTIQRLATYLKSISPRKVFLRIGYEFDGPWNCYTPELYKKSFIKITNAIRKAGASNVATVWQAAVWPDPTIAGENTKLYDHREPGMLESWYPGDKFVDWISISSFYRDLSQWNYKPVDTPQRAQGQMLDFARAKGKPVMVAEAAPQGYRIANQTKSFIHLNEEKPFSADKIWNAWFNPFFEFIYQNKDVIRSVAYINTHWDSQPFWQCTPGIPAGSEGCNNGNWGDSRVQANPLIKKRWLEQINNEKIWIQTGNY